MLCFLPLSPTKGIMFLVVLPLSVNAYWHDSSWTQWRDFNGTWHKYSSCDWTLMERFSRSEVKGQCYNGGGVDPQICINIHPDTVPPIHAVSYHVATHKPPPAQNGDKFRSILATIYNQSQLAERKHVARYWSINTAATAVPLSAHPSPFVITTKLAATILGGLLFGGGVLLAQ